MSEQFKFNSLPLMVLMIKQIVNVNKLLFELSSIFYLFIYFYFIFFKAYCHLLVSFIFIESYSFDYLFTISFLFVNTGTQRLTTNVRGQAASVWCTHRGVRVQASREYSGRSTVRSGGRGARSSPHIVYQYTDTPHHGQLISVSASWRLSAPIFWRCRQQTFQRTAGALELRKGTYTCKSSLQFFSWNSTQNTLQLNRLRYKERMGSSFVKSLNKE